MRVFRFTGRGSIQIYWVWEYLRFTGRGDPLLEGIYVRVGKDTF